MVNMRQALGVDDFNQMSNYTGQLQNQRRAVGQKQYGLGGKVLDMAAALGDAYNQYQPPETALGMMALPAKAVYGLGNMIVQDVGDKTKSIMGTDRSNPAAMDQAATDAFGLAADTMAGGGVVSRMTDMPTGAVLGANVFQGGPHKYGPEGAAESLKHMSKGEGAQAYGWGRYDAENKAVAQDYKNTLGNKVKQEVVTPEGRKDAIDFAVETLTKGISGDKLKSAEQTIRAIYGNMTVTQIKDAMTKSVIPTARGQRGLKKDKWDDLSFDETIEAYLYKHDLPDEDIARYLDWDAPLSEQPESVRAAFSRNDVMRERINSEIDEVSNAIKAEAVAAPVDLNDFDSLFAPNTPKLDGLINQKIALQGELTAIAPDDYVTSMAKRNPDMKAGDFYKMMESNAGRITGPDANRTKIQSNEAVAKALAKAGIPGLKYFDGMSRANTKAKISIDGVPDSTGAGGWVLRQNESNPQKALDKAINEIESFGKPLQGSARETDLATLKMWKKSPNSVEISNPRTRNFVTWDQDVLNRMKLLERNNEDMTKALMQK